jgi:outer membrane protein assembly factor BamB
VCEQWLFTGGKGTDSPAQAVCWSVQDGKERWQRRLPFCPCWSACHAGLVIVAGPEGVACLRQETGSPVWQMHTGQTEEQPSLSGFQLAGGHLFFRWKEERLVAADATTGQILWQEVAPGAGLGLPSPSGRILAYSPVGPTTVVVQTTGRRRLLQASSGACLHETADAAEPWPQPVLPLDERRVCIVSDPRHVTLLDAGSGPQARWTWVVPVGSLHDGLPPQLVGGAGSLLVLVGTNVGQLLYRLDPHTGRSLWDRPLYLGLSPVDTSGWAVDREAVYLIAGGQLQAWSLEEARLLWKQPVTEAGCWRVRRVGDWLLALPGAAARERFQFRWGPGTLQWEVGPLSPGVLSRPVECRDPQTGQLVQRLYLEARCRPRLDVSWHTTPARLSLTARIPAANGDEPDLRWGRWGGMAALGAEMWGLTVDK